MPIEPANLISPRPVVIDEPTAARAQDQKRHVAGHHPQRSQLITAALSIALAALAVLFMSYDLRGSLSFALELRARRLGALVLVGVALAYSAVLFHTITRNRILTPSLMGFDSLYVFMQTGAAYTLGTFAFLQIDERIRFLFEVGAMLGFAMVIRRQLLGRHSEDLYLLVLVGIVMGTMFSGLTSLLSRMIDPNEFITLQDQLFASFSAVDRDLLIAATAAIALTAAASAPLFSRLDAASLGRSPAVGLGVDYDRLVSWTLMIVVVQVSVATALVGPVTFLGLIASNLAYGSPVRFATGTPCRSPRSSVRSRSLPASSHSNRSLDRRRDCQSSSASPAESRSSFSFSARPRIDDRSDRPNETLRLGQGARRGVDLHRSGRFDRHHRAEWRWEVHPPVRHGASHRDRLWNHPYRRTRHCDSVEQRHREMPCRASPRQPHVGPSQCSRAGRVRAVPPCWDEAVGRRSRPCGLGARSARTGPARPPQARPTVGRSTATSVHRDGARQDTDYILLDEPLNNLDMRHAVHTMDLVRSLADDLGKTIVIVLHDINIAAGYADRIVAMREGSIVAHGPPTSVLERSAIADIYDIDLPITTIDGRPVIVSFHPQRRHVGADRTPTRSPNDRHPAVHHNRRP